MDIFIHLRCRHFSRRQAAASVSAGVCCRSHQNVCLISLRKRSRGLYRPFLLASFAGIQKSAATQNHVFALRYSGFYASKILTPHYGILRMRRYLNGKANLPQDILAHAFAGKVALEHLRNFIA